MEQQQRFTFHIFSEIVNSLKTKEQFFRVFSYDMSPKDKRAFKKAVHNISSLPKVKLNNKNELVIISGKSMLNVPISSSTPNKYKVGGYDWIYDPSASLEISQKALLHILEKVETDKKSANFSDLLFPKAYALAPVLYAAGVALVTGARLAAPLLARGTVASLGWVARMAGKIVENTIPSAVGSVVGGAITASAIISRQDKIPYGRALACLMSNFRDESCQEETVQAEIKEVTSTAEDLQFTTNECPTVDNRTFSWTMYNQATKTKIVRLANYNADGVITEMLEFHATALTNTSSGTPIYKVDSSKTIAYQFDGDGRLERVRKATLNGDIPLERHGNALNRLRPALVISGENLTEEQKQVAVGNRSNWLINNRLRKKDSSQGDDNPELIIMDRINAEQDPNIRETWDQYRSVVQFMKQIQPVMCQQLTPQTAEGPTSTAPLTPGDSGTN